MFKNNLIIALRTILTNRTNSIVNIAGLAIGLSCVILIALYVQDERRYDRFFKNADRIYQVDMGAMKGGGGGLISNTPPAVGPALVKKFPEIEAYNRIYVMGN